MSLILLCNASFSQKKVLVRQHLGYVENYGTGERDTGGKTLELSKHALDSSSLVFSLVSGNVDGINLVAKNKYDVWVSVISKASLNRIYEYDRYFRKYNQDSSFNAYMISVNGSHGQFSRMACKVKVDRIRYADADSTMYEAKYETDGKKEFKTVAADGVSYLNLYLNYPGNKYVTVSYPKIGRIRGENLFTSVGQPYRTVNLPLDESGYGQFRYYPPKYVSQKFWDQHANSKHHSTDANNFEWRTTLPVYVRLTYDNHRDERATDTVLINVCRTPVFFIHGFLGSAGTWSTMSGKLQQKGYITITNDYHAGAGSIEDQSRLLRDYINDYFNSANIKVKKVNLIAHSMGGLIARHYVKSRLYDKNVRKLITVGTPHHGVGNDDNFYDWVGYWAGEQAAGWYDKHKIGIQQLKENSSFLKRLNSGEVSGSHLIKGIQYGNIYTVPWDYVVWSNSAYLNMVESFVVYNVAHSKDLTGGYAITDHPDIEKQLLNWLETDIKRSRNVMVHAELSRASRGEVFRGYFKGDEYVEEKIATFPHKVNLTDGIITKEGTAIIHLKAGTRIWGSIFLKENTEIYIQNCSPHQMEIRMFRGRASFKSRKADGSHFIVSLHNRNNGIARDGLNVFSPLAYVRALDTEFAIENLDEIKIFGIEGKMEISTDITPNYNPVLISEQHAVIVNGKKINETEYSKPDWCIDLDKIIKEDDGPDDFEEEQLSDVEKTEKSSSESSEKSDMILGFIILGVGFIIVIIVIVLVIRLIKRKTKKS